MSKLKKSVSSRVSLPVQREKETKSWAERKRPDWLILAIAWVMVHIAVFAFSVFHGFWKAFFVIMAILAVAFGLYQNALIFVASIAMTFFIVFAGALIDVLLETARKSVGRMIVCGC